MQFFTAHPRRRLRLLTLCAALLSTALVLAGCTAGGSQQAAQSGSAPQAGEKPLVLTTFTVLADIARNVAGDHLQVESITKPGAEIHGYEPTPGDVAKAAQAQLVLDNGMNLEVWFEQFVTQANAPHAVVSKGVTAIDISSDAYAGKPNPHAWMSPANVEIYVDNIAAAMTKIAPAHAADFTRNAAAYKKELKKVHTELSDGLRGLPRQQRALVTCEGAFSYLARDAGLEEKYIWPVNAEQQATPQQIAAAIEFVKKNNVPAVFCESTVSDKAMQQVVKATDTRFGGTLYVDSLSAAGGPVPTYLDLIRHDVRTIVKGLTGK